MKNRPAKKKTRKKMRKRKKKTRRMTRKKTNNGRVFSVVISHPNSHKYIMLTSDLGFHLAPEVQNIVRQEGADEVSLNRAMSKFGGNVSMGGSGSNQAHGSFGDEDEEVDEDGLPI